MDSASDASLQSDGDCELEVRSDVGSDADSNGPPGLILSGSSSQGDHDDEGVELEVLSDHSDVPDSDHAKADGDVLSLQAVVARIQAAEVSVISDRTEGVAEAGTAAHAAGMSSSPVAGMSSSPLASPAKKRKLVSPLPLALPLASPAAVVHGCGIAGEPFPEGTHWWAQHIMDALAYWLSRRDTTNVVPFMLESLCSGTGAEVMAMKASICSYSFVLLALASLSLVPPPPHPCVYTIIYSENLCAPSCEDPMLCLHQILFGVLFPNT